MDIQTKVSVEHVLYGWHDNPRRCIRGVSILVTGEAHPGRLFRESLPPFTQVLRMQRDCSYYKLILLCKGDLKPSLSLQMAVRDPYAIYLRTAQLATIILGSQKQYLPCAVSHSDRKQNVQNIIIRVLQQDFKKTLP